MIYVAWMGMFRERERESSILFEELGTALMCSQLYRVSPARTPQPKISKVHSIVAWFYSFFSWGVPMPPVTLFAPLGCDLYRGTAGTSRSSLVRLGSLLPFRFFFWFCHCFLSGFPFDWVFRGLYSTVARRLGKPFSLSVVSFACLSSFSYQLKRDLCCGLSLSELVLPGRSVALWSN